MTVIRRFTLKKKGENKMGLTWKEYDELQKYGSKTFNFTCPTCNLPMKFKDEEIICVSCQAQPEGEKDYVSI